MDAVAYPKMASWIEADAWSKIVARLPIVAAPGRDRLCDLVWLVLREG